MEDQAEQVISAGALLAARSTRAHQLSFVRLVGESGSSRELKRGVEARSSSYELGAAYDELVLWKRAGFDCAALGTRGYPPLLAQQSFPPPLVFFKGSLESVAGTRRICAVVGARKARPESLRACSELTELLVGDDFCIVSGLAYGIDACAHRVALERRGLTVAVCGFGLKHCYPAAHRALAREILDQGGALISAYEPDREPRPHQFVARNQVIATLGESVLVVQAHDRSGSLSTARFGLEEGRDVLVVPGAYGDKDFSGSNQLLRFGAGVVSAAGDLVDHLDLSRVDDGDAEDPEVKRLEATELMRLLQEHKELPLDQALQCDTGDRPIRLALLDLESAGKVMRLPGNRIRYLG